jgi:hypothetical protein
MFDLFTADITCESAFNLRTPSFKVDAVVHNDFGEVLAPLFQNGIVQFAERGAEITAAAGEAADALDRALANAQATADQLRDVLEANRAQAYAVVLERQQSVSALYGQLSIVLAARTRAWSVYNSTSTWQVALRTQRRLAYVAANARYLTVATAYNGARALLSGARAVLDALPPVDQNILLLAANAATDALRTQLGQARDRLRVLEERFVAIGEAAARGEQLVAVEHAEFHGELSAASGGGAMDWQISGSFVGQPFEIRRSLDFSDIGVAAAQMLESLLAG